MSGQLYRQIVDRTRAGIWIVGDDSITLYANARMAQMLGCLPEEMVGRSFLDFLFPENHAVSKKKFEQVKLGQLTEVAFRFRRKDGSACWLQVAVNPFNDAKGMRVGLTGVFIDITQSVNDGEMLRKAHDELEQTAHEEAASLKEVNEAFRGEVNNRKIAEEKILEQAALLDEAHDAILVRDLDDHYLYWNKGAEQLYGWTAEETVGRNANELLYKEDYRPVEAKRIVLEKGEWIGKLQQVTKDGGEILVEARWTLVRDKEGKPKSILAIHTDITERKKLEAQLLRSQRLESIGMLANGIAHDLNNILTPITISIELLREEVKDEKSQNTIDVLEKSAERGARLVKQIQTFALGVKGEREALKVSWVISEVVQMVKETFPRNIKVKTTTAKNLLTILGDSTQLHQVLMNLCINARDAMPKGGNLTISAENFDIDENFACINVGAKVGKYIVITISDTGKGIPPEIMDRIFDPFFTTKELGKGSGLGLPTALGIVKSHGGFINVYSEVGKGSVFKIYLPAVEVGETKKMKEELLKKPTGHGEMVLVVEDEDPIREITRSTLEKHGYRVLTAKDGAEAITVYGKNRSRIKVVLMDIMMPSLGGQASIKVLRKMNSRIKIIVVSGTVEKSRHTRAKDTVQVLLPKPYTTEKLLKALHETLNA